MSSNIKPFEPEEFKRQAHLVIDFLVDYYKNANNYPVRSQVEPDYLKKRAPESAPHDPEPIEHILRDVQKDIIPGLTHWQSPNFFAYYPCNVSTAGFLGEMICTGFNVPGFDWISSPAATELEIIVMEWIGKMLQLPTKFLSSGSGGGVLHGSTCEAMLTTIVAARDRMLSKVGSNGINTLVVYASDQTHSAFQKAARIAGIPRHNIRTVPTARAENFTLAPAALKAAVETDVAAGLVPLFLCATVGTTSSASVDPLGPLCDVARAYGMWVHVDGAYAASACICPEYRRYINGVEKSDSFSFNAHKWFFTTLDCCCLWVKDPTALVRALSTNPEFLKNSASESKQVVDFKDWQISLSRRFRSMKLWFVLRSYGVANLRRFIREHIGMSQSFERMVKGDRRFEVVVPRSFSTVCFRISPVERGGEAAANECSETLLEEINKSGKIFMTHAVIGGVYVMRFVIGGSLTESRHVDRAWKVVVEHANAMLI